MGGFTAARVSRARASARLDSTLQTCRVPLESFWAREGDVLLRSPSLVARLMSLSVFRFPLFYVL